MLRSKFHIVLLTLIVFSVPVFGDGIMEVTTQTYPGDFLPLVTTEVTVEVMDQVVITTIENTFNNEASFDIDVKYHFPVPNSASVTGFGEYINGQLHLWGLQPGQGGGGGGTGNPSLSEYLGDNPFSIAMIDIPPGEKTIYLQYTGLLDYSFGDIIFEYPLWTPEYFIIDPTESIVIDIDIESQRLITGAISGNYPSNTTINQQSYNVTANFTYNSGFAPLDFDLQYSVSQEDIGAWLLTHVEADTLWDSDDGYFLLICEPGEISVGSVVQKYFTFILDKSGSMGGNKIEQAKDAATACVSLLGPNDYFNVIDFNTNIDMFSEEPVQATAENIDVAIEYIDDIFAGGGTNINDALLAGLEQVMGQQSANQIIFLTDGNPSQGVTSIPTILNNVYNANDDSACIFSFGIGNDVSEELLEGLALQNRGATFYIEPGAPIDEAVINFFLSIMNPVFINVVLDFTGIDTRDVFPVDAFNIYYGSQTLVFGRNQDFGATTISLSGTVVGVDTTLVYTGYEFPEENPENSFVARMWAISYIDYWTAWMVVNGEDEEIIDMIILLSLKYGILTDYTNYQGINELNVIALNGVPQGNGIMLTWMLNQLEPGLSYEVYRSQDINGPFVKLNDESLTTTSYYDYTAVPGQVYYYKIKITAIDGSKYSDVFMVGDLPEVFVLSQNYPNPFNCVTGISYSMPVESMVKLEIFNLLGQRIKTLDYGLKASGLHHSYWDGTDYNGIQVSSGHYLYRLSAEPKFQGEPFSDVRKMILLK